MAVRSRTGYSGIQIALHWIIALLVVIRLLLGDETGAAHDNIRQGWTVSVVRYFWTTVHYYNGLAILSLVLLRLALRLIRGAPLPAPRGLLQAAAVTSHTAFYLVLIAMPVLGRFAYYRPDDIFGDLHELGVPLLIALICVHAGAAVYHQIWLTDGTLNHIPEHRPGKCMRFPGKPMRKIEEIERRGDSVRTPGALKPGG